MRSVSEAQSNVKTRGGYMNNDNQDGHFDERNESPTKMDKS